MQLLSAYRLSASCCHGDLKAAVCHLASQEKGTGCWQMRSWLVLQPCESLTSDDPKFLKCQELTIRWPVGRKIIAQCRDSDAWWNEIRVPISKMNHDAQIWGQKRDRRRKVRAQPKESCCGCITEAQKSQRPVSSVWPHVLLCRLIKWIKIRSRGYSSYQVCCSFWLGKHINGVCVNTLTHTGKGAQKFNRAGFS